MNNDPQQGNDQNSNIKLEQKLQPCCCGQSKTGVCDGSHLVNSSGATYTREMTFEEAKNVYGDLPEFKNQIIASK